MLGAGRRLHREFRVYELTASGSRLRWSRILPIRPYPVSLDSWLGAEETAAIEAMRLHEDGRMARILTPGDNLDILGDISLDTTAGIR